MGVADCEQAQTTQMSGIASDERYDSGRTTSTLGQHAMEVPGIAPFVATLLFGKCPMFDIARVLRPSNHSLDDYDSDEESGHSDETLYKFRKHKENTSLDARTGSLTADDSSSTLSTCEEKPEDFPPTDPEMGLLGSRESESEQSDDPLQRIPKTDEVDECKSGSHHSVVLPESEPDNRPLSSQEIVADTEKNSELIFTENEQQEEEAPKKEEKERLQDTREQEEEQEEQSNESSPQEEDEKRTQQDEDSQEIPTENEATCDEPQPEHKQASETTEQKGGESNEDKTKVRFKAQVIFPADFTIGSPRRKGSVISKSVTSVSKSLASRAASIVSASKSVMSLPREAELFDISEDISNKSPKKSNKRKMRRKSSDSDIHQVTSVDVKNPYGQEGSFTGSLSKRSGKPHGFGRFVVSSTGTWYEGNFKQGEWIGKGRLSHKNGDFYKGCFNRGLMHGEGKITYADGRIFDGSFMFGQMVQGQMSYPDGSLYNGGWFNGLRHGRGQCIFSDQSLYIGEFREGEFHGFGKMLWMDGGYYEGEWENGDRNGYGKEILKNGNLKHEGQWSRGQPLRNAPLGAL